MTGTEIKDFRTSKGLTQEQFGNIIGVGKSSVNNWEKGRAAPSGSSLLHLENLMSGEWAIIPLTAQEEILLDDGVKKGGYSDREEYLFASLTHLIRNANFDTPETPQSFQPAMVAEDPAPYSSNVHDPEEAENLERNEDGGESSTAPN